MKDLKIKYSEWEKFTPYEFYILELGKGKIYSVMGQEYVKFKAMIKVVEEYRPFNLVLPYHKVIRAIQTIPVKIKQSRLLRIVFEKHDNGVLKIIDIEVIDK